MPAQVHWLTLGANLVNASAQFFLQLPEIETIAYETNITVSRQLRSINRNAQRASLSNELVGARPQLGRQARSRI